MTPGARLGFWVPAQEVRGFQIYPKLSTSPAGILRCVERGWALRLTGSVLGAAAWPALGFGFPERLPPPQGLPHTPTRVVTSRGSLKSHVDCIIKVDMATWLSSYEIHMIITENSENTEKHIK